MNELERIQKSFLRIADIGISKEEIKKLVTTLSKVANLKNSGETTMTINETIIAQLLDFEAKTGIKPNAIYLGEAEMDMVKKFYEEMAGLGEFLKSEIYEIKSKSHLSVGRIDENNS